jgi:hypothetical protein
MTDSLLLNPAEVRARHILAYVFRYGADFPLHITALIDDLAGTLDIDESVLDRSLDSLAAIDEQVRARCATRGEIEAHFPGLVAYMGEVLIERHGGSWYMLWRPDFAVWEPYVVTDAGEFCDPFTRLYDQIDGRSASFSMQAAIAFMTEDAGL